MDNVFSINEENIKKAGKIIRNGGLVAFPTETVYGLGGDGLNPRASKSIYAAKGRPSDNPLIIHICELNDIYRITKDIPDEAFILADKLWPGPLTLILKATEAVPRETTGGLMTVAVRMPSHRGALRFIKEAGGFVAAPSANTSGRPSPTKAAHVWEDLGSRVDMILDGGDSVLGLESTILDLTEDEPVILRPGFITREDIEDILGKRVLVDEASTETESCTSNGMELEGSAERGRAPKAPGMKYRHYAPRAVMLMVKGEPGRVTDAITERAKADIKAGKKVGIICTEETFGAYSGLGANIKSLGRRTDLKGIAAGIYDALRNFDSGDTGVIYSEYFDEEGIGAAIMNRLKKAAGGNIIKV